MKKLLLIFFLLFAAKSFAQYPLVQGLGNDSTLIRVGQNYKGGIKGGLINMSVADTTAANLLRIKAYPGAQIYTDDGSVWIRNITATGWSLLGGGVSPSGSFWAIGGNLFPVTVPSRNIGTLSPYGGAIGLMTNSVVHAIVPDAGFTLANDTTAAKVFTWNPTSKEWGYANWNNGGGSYTFTNGLTESAGTVKFGGTLTENTTIGMGNRRLLFNGANASWLNTPDSVKLYNTRFILNGKWALSPDAEFVIKDTIGGWETYQDLTNYDYGKYKTQFGIAGNVIQSYHFGNYSSGCTTCGRNTMGFKFYQNASHPSGVDTLLWALGAHNGPGDHHAYLADLTDTYANANRYLTIEKNGTAFVGFFNNPVGNFPQSLFGPSAAHTTVPNWENWHVIVGGKLAITDTLLSMAKVKFSGINTGIPAGAKRVLIDASGNLYAADTTAGGGSSTSPAGNFGNLQINRNGAFATPGSDSLDFESATGLSVKGNISTTTELNAPRIESTSSSLELDASGGGHTIDMVLNAGSTRVELYDTWQFTWGYPGVLSPNLGLKRDADAVLKITNGTSGTGDLILRNSTFSGRNKEGQGADVASANNLSLGTDGNAFEITGTTTINLISNTNWQNGSVIRLVFSSSLTVTNNAGTSGSNINILLAGGANFSATANDILTLMLCEIGSVQNWVEVSRSVN